MFSASCVQECVCFQSLLLFCCVNSSVWVWFLQAVRNPVGWKLYPEPWVLSSHGNQLPGWLQTFFWCSYLQSLRILLIYEPILMNIESVTSGRWRKYLVQSRDKYAEFSPSFLVAFWWCCLWGAVFYSGSSRSKGGKMSCKWGQVCERLQSKCALYSTISRTDGTGVYKIR